MCRLNNKTSCIDHIKINIVSYNPSDICNAFAEHFASIGKYLAQKNPSTKKNLHNSKIGTISLPKPNNWMGS